MNKAQQIRKAPKFMVYIDTASDYKGKFKPTDKMIKKLSAAECLQYFMQNLKLQI